MAQKIVVAIDPIDAKLIEQLGGNSRIAMSDLARAVGLSAPSATERVRKLEAAGVIRSFTIDLDPKSLGYTLEAVVRIKPRPGQLHLVERQYRPAELLTHWSTVCGTVFSFSCARPPHQPRARIPIRISQYLLGSVLIQSEPRFVACDKVTGDDCFIARLWLTSIGELDVLLDDLHARAETNTSIVKSSPVAHRMPPLLIAD